MALELTSLADLKNAGFDDIIDARSPSEFLEDHLPGAISLPVLDDAERARVGTMYVQDSRFRARKVGAALVIRNVATHLETALADRTGAWRPLVYCWRGGQRSGTFAWLLSEIGWRVETVQGGYQSYRKLVVRDLYDRPLPHRFVVLEGMTCTAKTDFLHLLAAAGCQVLDLEGAARHRGSVFGGYGDPQPSQKAFESKIAETLSGFDPAHPVIVESESSKVGNLLVPPSVWTAMCAAPRVRLEASLADRAQYFPQAYPDLVSDRATFSGLIAKFHRLHGAALVARWQGLVEEGDFVGVAAELMREHYDPRYTKSAARHGDAVVGRVALAGLTPDGLRSRVPEVRAALEDADANRV